jgi:hypothetical protein
MVRLFGISKPKGKKRLSPSARTPEGMREKHPMFQYAINEYSQTVAAGTSNDDGRNSTNWISAYDDMGASSAEPPSSSTEDTSSVQRPQTPQAPYTAPALDSKSTISDGSVPSINPSVVMSDVRTPFEAGMPDATYEEEYGEAYTGGPIKYIYPSGYQSMRPRSCPWKLSIVVCVLFTWLSVFIVGHCSDQSQYRNEEIDDDTLAIDIRWCGSRPLYLMWVMSMLITGVAAAYCSVIGYIKVRDFSVANARSQPPGVVNGKSDYYVRIEDGGAGGAIKSTSSDGSYRPSIYQSDGTPQFWGAHIYRPTQAAVAVTSR